MYAYYTAGHGAMPKKTITKGIRYKGMVFADVSSLSAYFSGIANFSRAKTVFAANTPTVFSTPRKILSYPYSADSLWDYNPDYTTVRIARKYIGKEKVKCKAGTFECYKVQWLWDWDLDGTWDDDYLG